MKLNKHCHCKINPCKCSSNTKTITPIILKKNRDKIDSCKNNISEPELLPVKNKCPTNKISSISRLGNEIIVVMDDCTYYYTDINSIDLDSFQRNNNPPEEEKDIYVKDISFSGSELKLIRTDGVELKVDLSTFSTGSGLTVISVKAKENGNTLEVTYRDINTGEITKEDVIIEGDTQDIENLINNLNNKIDASKIKSTELSNGTYTITLEDNTKFDTDFSGLITADKFVNSGAVISGNKLQLNFNDGSSVEIDLSSIVVTSSGETVLITGGSINGNILTLNLSNATSIDVDITGLISGIVNQVTNNIESTVIENATNQVINNFLKLGYRINTQDNNYTLVQDDFDGRTIVRMNSASNQTLTVIKPDNEEKIGTVVMVRRSNGNAGTLLTLVAGKEVTLSPVDISPLRRIGSSVSMIYIGNGHWDVFGELP